MQHSRPVIALVIAAALASGCGGGSSDDAAPSTTSVAPPELVGTWITEQWSRTAGDELADVPATLRAERWTITRPEGCDEPCDLELTTSPADQGSGSFDMTLQPDGDGWVATFHFVSSCVHPTTRAMLEPRASEVEDTLEVRMDVSGASPTLAISSTWDGEPTDAGIAVGCEIRSATFETTAQPEASEQ